MKRFILTLAAATLASAASADSIYVGIDQGNPDLYSGLPIDHTAAGVIASPPAVGSGFNRYHGLDKGSPDLFGPTHQTAAVTRSEPADVYHGVEVGNPDLR